MANELSFHSLQLQRWAQDALDQKNSGLTVREWCRQKNLSVNTYNYRMKVLKRSAVQSIPSRVVEIRQPDPLPVSASPASTVGEITISINDVTISVRSNDLFSALSAAVKAARNA
ncbi:MAG: hypothetical protein SPL71_15930 [Oribacterium sp.]|nr:hypothetical protein [Oribacterium sp.]